ncbi:16729_t:CDS:1, partial [Cetraspora pellucida]
GQLRCLINFRLRKAFETKFRERNGTTHYKHRIIETKIEQEQRKERDKLAHYKRRATENDQQREYRQERERVAQRKCRATMNNVEREKFREQNKLAQHKYHHQKPIQHLSERNQINDNYNIEPFYLGPCVICNYCEAKKFVGESN